MLHVCSVYANKHYVVVNEQMARAIEAMLDALRNQDSCKARQFNKCDHLVMLC